MGANAGERRHDAVVFDLGGVLVDWNPRYVYRRIFAGDEETVEWFLAEVCTPDWNECQDAGRPFSEGIGLLVREFPEYEAQIRAYHDRWEEMLGGAIEESVAVLEALKGNSVPLYALSNWSRETFPIARRRFPFLSLFEGVLVSGEIGLIKPDPRIFRHLERTCGLAPERSVFIDDSLRNVEAARGLGYHALHFSSPRALKFELEKLGLL